jgi:ATP-dependent helicase HrpA
VELERLQRAMEAAEERAQARRAALPTIRYEQDLPINAHRDEIAQALRDRQVLVVAGETGSGKSTQLPKICLEAGLGAYGLIGHTQPRRIAARAIAARLVDELGVTMGQEVGYKIRFTDRTDRRTFIKLMTDGILLAETQQDRFLDQYQVIILDEAHERSLNIDFLLGYFRQKLPERPDLRLIITSATIDAERFAEHFSDANGPAPIIEVSGRTYPVETRYRPLATEEGEELDVMEGVVAAVHELARIDRGHILVFLPTERDIREMARRLRGEPMPGDGSRSTEILPLYARLSAREQNRIFEPSSYRRIVLATNVAESSLTVPDIRYVVDTGTARISRYSPRSKILRLPIEPVSQASANQRAGRCGRVAPGICIRLYDEADYEQREPYTTPEIRRTNLASVILQAKMLRLGEIETYPFLDPPRPDALRDGYKTLFELQAIDHQREITTIGRQLARMPVDPRIGRMILAAADERCLHEVLIIASALELQDPRERPHDKQQQADERHEQFLDEESDFLSYLKLWDFYHHLKETVSRNQLRKACQQNFLSYTRLREWTEIHRQLLQIAEQTGLRVEPRKNEFTPIHRSLLTGLLSGVSYKTGDFEYTGGGGLKLNLWPGSGLFRKRPAWIMAAERVETAKIYARVVSRISPTWIEPLADHLVKRSYSDPHWSKKSGTVMAYEKVSLMGMPIVVGRKVHYGKLDPETSRRLFIQHALVDERMDAVETVVRQNRELREQIASLAAKTRQRAYVLDDYSIFMYYDERLPPDVYDVASLRRWLRASAENRKAITMHMDDLIEVPGATGASEATQQFPETLQVGSVTVPVHYHFVPGEEDDGVTITVPAAAVNQLSDQQMNWLVPGLLEEKITALIRSLPKSLRRNFVPVPDTAKRLAQELPFGQGDFLQSLSTRLSQIAEEPVVPAHFDESKLPSHLRMNVRVVDDAGEPQQMGRDLSSLQRTVRSQPADGNHDPAAQIVADAWHRDHLTAWDFPELPIEVPLERGGIQMLGYPVLIDQGSDVQLRLLDNLPLAEHQTRRAVTRLYVLAQQKSLRTQIRWLPRFDEVAVWSASLMDQDTLRHHLQMRIAELAFLGRKKTPRTKDDFEARLVDASERIAMATQEFAPWLPRTFEAYHRVRLSIESLGGGQAAALRSDLQEQRKHLFADDFLMEVPWMWLQHFPRYLQAMELRVEKWQTGAQQRDREASAQVSHYWQQFLHRQADLEQRHRYSPELIEYRWMIEEFRVSLFAQQLGTATKISAQRLDKQWEKVTSS